MKKKYWIIGVILVVALIIFFSIYTYLRCGLFSKHDIGLYYQCNEWKKSGYKDEKFPIFIRPNINEEYVPPIPKEDIINQAKERCEDILARYGICKILGLW